MNVTRFYYTYAPRWIPYTFPINLEFNVPPGWEVSPNPVAGGIVGAEHYYPDMPRENELSACTSAP